MSITVSEQAKRQLLELGVGEHRFLRVSVVAGGCAGSTYSAAIDDTMNERDTLVYRDGELRVICSAQSARHLEGLQIDYSDDLIQSGFRFNNPLAAKSCGCGASFATLSSFPGSA